MAIVGVTFDQAGAVHRARFQFQVLVGSKSDFRMDEDLLHPHLSVLRLRTWSKRSRPLMVASLAFCCRQPARPRIA
eukprot:3633889-Pyramimonas_sp.AAC.1